MKRPLMPEETHQPGSVVERTGGMEIALSVVLPVYNAMPWLTICVRDMLKQQLEDEGALELVVAVDGCTDDSLQFLQELATALGSRRATVEECPPPLAAGQGLAAPDRAKEDDRSAPQSDGLPASSSASLNPALAQPLRAPATSDHPSFAAGHVASGAAAVSTSGAGSHAKNTPPQPLSGADLAEPGPSPEPLTAGAVAAACRSEHRLLVLFYRTNCGQGAAMSLALSRCRSPLIAQMESDDERPDPFAFRRMLRSLSAHPAWDGVSCVASLCGAEDRVRMQAYLDWQNSLSSPAQMAAGRFIEMPALHQTAIFRRAAVDAVLAPTGGSFRDGSWRRGHGGGGAPCNGGGAGGGGAPGSGREVGSGGAGVSGDGSGATGSVETKAHSLQVGLAAEVETVHGAVHDDAEAQKQRLEDIHGDAIDTPVDMWWWLAFFHAGMVCGKVAAPPLLGWRQHPRQHTRTHGRLSIDSLRRIKVHFLMRRGGPLYTATQVVIVSVGCTLSGWETDVRAHPRSQGKHVLAVEWKPAKRGGPGGGKGGGFWTALLRSRKNAEVPSEHVVQRGGAAPVGERVVRLWAFGNETVRQRVRQQVGDWEESNDWFVA